MSEYKPEFLSTVLALRAMDKETAILCLYSALCWSDAQITERKRSFAEDVARGLVEAPKALQ